MKKLISFLGVIIVILFLNFNLYGECLGDPIGKVLDLYGGQGVDSVVVLDNYAYVSLNYSGSINNPGVRGLAKVDISNPENLKSYVDTTEDNDSYTLDQYLNDISSYVTIYYYGTDFKFDENLTEPLDSYIVKAIKNLNNNVILYGYSNGYSDNVSFLWTFNTDTKELNYIKVPDYTVENIKYLNGFFFILFKNIADNKDYKIATYPLAPITDNNFNWENFIIYSYQAQSDNDYPMVDFYVSYEDNNDYEIDIIEPQDNSTYVTVVDFSEANGSFSQTDSEQVNVPLRFSKIIYDSCNYIIVSDFDKLYFIKEENDNFSIISTVNVWDVAKTFVYDNILYVANMGGNVNAIDIGDPYHPYIIDNGTFMAATNDITYANGKVYVAYGWGGLAVYNADTCVSKATTDYYNNCDEDNTTDFTDNTSTDQCDSACFTADDVNQITATWYLAGTGCNITDMSIFNNVKSVWLWDSNTWKIYSPLPEINAILQNYHIGTITEIPAKRGFWINTQ